MMMQMLKAGGVEIETDNIRKSDINNPMGYYELEKVKKMREDSSWLETSQGKTIKIISSLLVHLPNSLAYQVVFMRRALSEVIASQKAMISKLGNEDPNIDEALLIQKYELHIKNIKKWLDLQKNMDVLYVNYKDVVTDPVEHSKQIDHFIHIDLNIDAMANAVTKKLYRQQQSR